MKKQIEYRDPNELSIHPAAKRLPEWAKTDKRYEAFVEDVRERGIDQPLLVDPEGRILNGRMAWRAAKQLQLREVPVLVKAAEDAVSVILHSLVQRKHYTKGALAYLAYPLLEAVLDESRSRRLKNLKNPNDSRKSIQSTIGAKRVEDFALELGFSRDLLFQAKQLHGLFEKSDKAVAEWVEGGGEQPADWRAQFEQKVIEGEIGLGAAIAGIAGQSSTKGLGKQTAEQLELFTEGFEAVEKRFRYWQSFDEKAKNLATPIIFRFVESMPADLREVLAKALKRTDRTGQ